MAFINTLHSSKGREKSENDVERNEQYIKCILNL